MKALVAEALGTFILVVCGCGAAAFAASFPVEGVGDLGIGLHGVSFAFGLVIVGCVYAFGGISGCHLNPAVTAGLFAAGRFESSKVPGYVIAQVVGAVAGAGCLLLILQGHPDAASVSLEGVANGYGEHSPGRYSMVSGFVSEALFTFIFLTVILGATSPNAPVGFAGLAIGLTLTVLLLVGIPITNLSVNPARSTGPALFIGGWAIGQLWLFWVAPIVGGGLAGLLARFLYAEETTAS
ncbi:MAG: aquaporin Z [Rhodopirellula sp. JB044]|uniref:aquaporin Z n=1 Tax=Rhodopirellula sp. JB044 TaxID=3342844 RepID=UPI00370ADC86